MRIIAGTHGGRALRVPPGRGTRPTSDRVREALFSILGSLEGASVLDLFAGSGALGIEALSRGATHATFVEHHPDALLVLRENLATLGLGADRATVRAADARAALARAAQRSETYALVFVDPPYAQATRLGEALTRPLAAVLAPGGRVVGESDRRAPLALGLPFAFERRYGDTLIRIHHDPEPRT